MFTAKTLGVGESTEPFMIEGECDIWVSGLTSGTVELKCTFPGESGSITAPNGSFTEDVMKTVYIAEHGVMCTLEGIGNNAGVYVRLATPTRR